MPWITTGTPDGPTTLTASVRDPSNNTGTGSIPVTVQNGSSQLTAGFSTPAQNATVSGSVTVGMTASGGTAPYTYTLTIDAGQVASGASTTYGWDTGASAAGSHTLGLTVRDNSGATATASITVTVGGGGTLSVAVTTPSPGATVSGTVWVTIWVDGAAAGNKTYTITANGTQVWNESNGDSPASLPWVTTNGRNGTKALAVPVRASGGAAG